MTTDFQKRDTASGQFFRQPRYSKDDRVTIRGTGSQRAIWIVDSVLLPTSTNPKIGYLLKAGNGHSRSSSTARLTLAGDS